MNFNKSVVSILALFILILFSEELFAIPSFARQTNLACSSCHTIFPELNAFGRLFKLNGYTFTAIPSVQSTDSSGDETLRLVSIPGVSAMLQASYTYISKKQPDTQNNNLSFPQQLSVFLAGAVTPKIGGFIQVTYDDQSGSIGLDNTDIRYADQTELASQVFIYGVSLNNNPSVQDPWNSTPVWGFPYSSSSVAPAPAAATLIEGRLAQNTAGLGMYGIWNTLIYGEFSLYRSAQQGAPNPPDGSSSGVIKNFAPYWRLALQKQLGGDYFEIGTYGIAADLYPAGISGSTDNYTDIGFDLNYEKGLGDNMITARTTYIHETQNLNATLAGMEKKSNNLNSFKIVGNYYLHQQIGFSLGYFLISGDALPALYTPGIVSGSLNGEPDSNGIIAQFSYLPWLNTQFTVQYIAYTKFNGSTSNYDGFDRNASDNNTLYVESWIAF